MDLPQLSFSTWAGIGASAALLGSFWRQVVTLLGRLCDLFICRIAVKEEAARAVMVHVMKRGRRSPFGLRLFGGVGGYVQPKKRVEVIGYEGVTNEALLFWFGGVPVLVGNGQPNSDTHINIGTQASDAHPVFIRFLRGTLNPDELIEEAITAFNQRRQCLGEDKGPKRFNVIHLHGGYPNDKAADPATRMRASDLMSSGRGDASETIQQLQRGEMRLLTWKPEELTERSSDQPPFDLYPFSAEPMSILPEIEMWLAHEQWFRSKGVPWRRGYLAHGLPGAGKSTFIRSVAIKHDLPLYVFDLASMDNQSFAANWKTVQQNGPAIALFEDLDTLYHGREFVATASKNRDTVTFDCLLNTISGVGSSDGVLLFITTNHVASLDPALGVPAGGKSTRPGRIDRTIYFGPMELEQRLKLAQFILSDFAGEVGRIVAEGEGETAAQFQERCAQFAEKAFWERGQVELEPNRRVIEVALARENARQDKGLHPF